jgi:hypothetical protein
MLQLMQPAQDYSHGQAERPVGEAVADQNRSGLHYTATDIPALINRPANYAVVA